MWACVDEADGSIGSAKHPRRWGKLLEIGAELTGEGMLRLDIAGAQDAEVALSRHLGRPVRLTRELHVRIEGDWGRRKFAQVEAFAATTGMTLLGVSHAASEQLVIETQLARWCAETLGVSLRPIREPCWWR